MRRLTAIAARAAVLTWALALAIGIVRLVAAADAAGLSPS